MKYRDSNQKQQMTPRKKKKMSLDYAATYPNAVIRYKSSNMVLRVDLDASYINIP